MNDIHPPESDTDTAGTLRGRLRAFAVAGLAALVVTATLTGLGALAATGPAAAQSAGYTVSVEFPSNFTTNGSQTVRVVVENTGDDLLFNPVVEVPMPNGLSVDGASVASAQVRLPNGSTESRTAEIGSSSYRSGQALFIDGEEVPANTEYVYEFEVGVSSAGNKTVEAEVRPLYNADLSVRDSSTAYATGFGTLDVTVMRPDGSPVAGADVLVDGSSVGAGTTSVAEGRHTVVVQGPDGSIPLPTLGSAIDVGEVERLTYTVPRTLDSPTVVATDRSSTVVDGSAGELTRNATASLPASYDLSFVVDASGGRTVVAFPTPSSIPADELDELTATADSGSVSLETIGDTVRANVSADADTTVTVSYDGERLGDVSADGTVDGGDASAVASAVASGTATGAYADVNDDGQVNSVDAMLIAQYANGERDVNYALGGGD